MTVKQKRKSQALVMRQGWQFELHASCARQKNEAHVPTVPGRVAYVRVGVSSLRYAGEEDR